MFVYCVGTVTAFVSRRWVLRNWEALEMYFSETRRHVTLYEILLGIINSLIVLWLFYVRCKMFSESYTANHVLCSELVVVAFYSLPQVSLCYLLCLLFGNVNTVLKNNFNDGSIRSYEQCCNLLESVNTLLGGVHDELLLSFALLMILLESVATVSECDSTANIIPWITFTLAPYAALVTLADQTSNLMRKKRKRIRQRWNQGPPNLELLTIYGHRNAFGIRWLVDSSDMNYVSALSVLNSVFVYASLILTTPAFLHAEGRYDIFCVDDCSGAKWFRELSF